MITDVKAGVGVDPHPAFISKRVGLFLRHSIGGLPNSCNKKSRYLF